MTAGSDLRDKPSGAASSSWLPTYLFDARSYFLGPRSFLQSQDLSGNDAVKKALKTLALGALGVLALSAVSLKLSPLKSDEDARKLFEGTRTATAVFLGSVLSVALVHWIARLLRGQGRWRQTWISFALTLGFTWPATALGLILVASLGRLLTGLPWTALPPFDVALLPVENTVGNMLIVAGLATLYLWMLGGVLYCYASAIMVAHQLGVFRSGVVIATLVAVDTFVTPISRATLALADLLDPLVQWLIKLL